MFMRNLKVLFIAFFVALSLNSYATGIDDFCVIVKEAMSLINQERARLRLKPLEFKNVVNKEEVKSSAYRFWISFYSLNYTSQGIFKSVEDKLNDERYAYAFVYYSDGAYHLCFAEDIMLADEFKRYVASWYDKIFEDLDYSASFEAEVLRLVNIERAKRRIAPLEMEENLHITARIKAGEMKKYNYYGHGSFPDLPDYLIKRYYLIGENIAMGQTTPAEVVKAWMNSPGHKDNILNPNYAYIGIGYCADHWVQQFAYKSFEP